MVFTFVLDSFWLRARLMYCKYKTLLAHSLLLTAYSKTSKALWCSWQCWERNLEYWVPTTVAARLSLLFNADSNVLKYNSLTYSKLFYLFSKLILIRVAWTSPGATSVSSYSYSILAFCGLLWISSNFAVSIMILILSFEARYHVSESLSFFSNMSLAYDVPP